MAYKAAKVDGNIHEWINETENLGNWGVIHGDTVA